MDTWRALLIGVLTLGLQCSFAAAEDPADEDQQAVTRFAGYFSSCAREEALSQGSELHEITKAGGDAGLALIMKCDEMANKFLRWCGESGGRDIERCYRDLRDLAENVLKQAGD